MTEKLNGCPECFGKNIDSNKLFTVWAIECLDCGYVVGEKTEEEAIKAWNRRKGDG